MFESLQNRLQSAFKTLAGKAKLTEGNMRDALKLVETALLEADVSYSVAREFIEKVSEKALGEKVLLALNPTQQLKLARKGEIAERVLLERLYGKQVWEALLQNPRITLPEVARIARKGSVPRPTLELIWENAGWIKDQSIRRALLANTKLPGDTIVKLLRLMPRHELKVLEKGTAYPAPVREAARKLLRE